MNGDDAFAFREGYWTKNVYLVPEGKGLENIQKILKDKQILTKKEWLLNCSLKDKMPNSSSSKATSRTRKFPPISRVVFC